MKRFYGSEMEKCHYAQFEFRITMLYDEENFPLHGVVHLKQKDDASEIDIRVSVETKPDETWTPLAPFLPLPISITLKSRKKRDVYIDFGPLDIYAVERGYLEEDIYALKIEIMRRIDLMNAIRSPKGSFLEMADFTVLNFPEVAEEKYLERLPEKIRKEIEKFLAKQ